MLKIVVLDCGYGGEFLADRIEEEIGVVEVIRVIDWRHSEQYLNDLRAARSLATTALRPYIGKVDLIILANHLLSLSSLNFFYRKFPKQKFVGLKLKHPDTFVKKNTLILTTKSVTKTFAYRSFIFHLKRRVKTLCVDDWPEKIDEGELNASEIKKTIGHFIEQKGFKPEEVILGCSQFEDIRPVLKHIFGRSTKIYSSFDDTIREACKLLKIRGSVRKIKE